MEKNALWKEHENENRMRHFRVLSMGTLPVMFAYFLIMNVLGYGDISTVTLVLTFSALGIDLLLTWVGIKRKRPELVAPLIALLQILIIIPVFISMGGFSLGSTVWYALTVLYIAIVIEGPVRYFLYATEAVMAAAMHYYFYAFAAERVHTLADYVACYIGVFLVCLMIVLMVSYEIRLQKETAKKAMMQAAEIEELNRAQSRFFSSMSHEIRTPINTIIGLNEMILREDISDEVAEDARNIRSASSILLSLINDILDMSKIESGRMDIIKAPYDVAKMLSDVTNMIVGSVDEKGLKFTIDVDPLLPSQLYSDEVRIKQILINLLNNAVKYTREGRVSLSVHCRNTGDGKVLVTYSVDDTGTGIRKESMPHLFDAFRREDEQKNHYIEGTGLGLSIVRLLTQLLGGELSVNSVYTKGSTFTVAIEQEIADEKPVGRFDMARLKDKGDGSRYHQSFEAPEARVLIVDDNRANLLVAGKLLRDTKVMTDTAGSGAEALELTLQNHYDVIFMDHMMPEMDGIECLHAIRQQAGGLNKDTCVVALTANAGGDSKALYRREGFDEYILKPIEGNVLEAVLLKLLPEKLVNAYGSEREKYASEDVVREMRKKKPILITTDSICDLPAELLARNSISVLPYRVYMKGRVFADGLEAQGDVLLRYMEDKDISARSEAPEVKDYEEFFSEQLTGAQHIIHIAMAKHASRGYENAGEASLSFYNVKVVDSGQLSSGTGLLALAAAELIDKGISDEDELGERLDEIKERIQTSFIVDSTEYLNRGGRLSDRIYRLCNAFMLHPVIVLKNSRMRVGGIYMGSAEKVRLAYIKRALHDKNNIDTSLLFITYAGMKKEELEVIKEEVQKIVAFDKVYIQKASPAISINCGPGTFGLLFGRKR
ncbi:MAG: DegV family EDD domain-containing protein [Lachnospiraceae bacterium]|nr:DegV family EDD domain-containing protein [Lachnospiraceae bacterium]